MNAVPLAIGSSPRVRGTPQKAEAVASLPRFIPACAGNAARLVEQCLSPTVHPRVCGERKSRWRNLYLCSGSSPRVRGTQGDSNRCYPRPRFIPACAGNAFPIPRLIPPASVHPRVCGERWRVTDGRVRQFGSSPRVRGTPADETVGVGRSRFIPACAGNALSCEPRTSGAAVHPRVCGEREKDCHPSSVNCGSSPRVRGTHFRRTPNRQFERFIPACAGNAQTVSGTKRRFPVHPRVCGERGISTKMKLWPCGSSPRVRGTGSFRFSGSHSRRFIPACAGNG